MLSALKSELAKLLTVRSTYALFVFCVVLMGIFNFYALGVKASPQALAQDPSYLMRNTFQAIQNLAMLGSLVGILLVTHEYRYNTVVYSLTAVNSRTKVLLAKIIAVSMYAVVFTIGMGILAMLMLKVGLAIGGHDLIPQTINYHELIWRSLAYMWGVMMLGLLFAALVRSQVAAIATFFIWPALVEGLATLLIHNNAYYLPFNLLGTVISGQSLLHGVGTVKAFLIVLATLVGGWIVAWVLYLRRDAN